MSVGVRYIVSAGKPDAKGRQRIAIQADGDIVAEDRIDPAMSFLREKLAKAAITKADAGRSRVATPDEMANYNPYGTYPSEDDERQELADRILAASQEAAAEAACTGAPLSSTTPIIVNAADVKPTSLSWLWFNRFALGKFNILAGDPGLGKSFLTCDIAARVSLGECWPDSDFANAPQGGVVMLNCEDDYSDTLVPRLMRHAANLKRISFVDGVRDPLNDGRERQLNLADDLPALEAAIKQSENCKLVIVDPISAYMGKVDSHSNADVRGVLAPLSALAADYRVAVIGVSHLNKGTGAAMYRTMGSLAFVAAARSAWCVTKDKDDESRRLLLNIKNNNAPDVHGLAFRITDGLVDWQGEVTTTAEAALSQDNKPGPDAEDRNEAAAYLLAALTEGPRPSKDIAEEAREAHGITQATLRRAQKELKIESYRPRNPGPWYWRLPACG